MSRQGHEPRPATCRRQARLESVSSGQLPQTALTN